MKHFLIVGIAHEADIPKEVLALVLKLYDKKKEVDLKSDDFVTVFPVTSEGRHTAINMSFDAKDYKTAVFDVMEKAQQLGRGWKVLGPVKTKQYFFSMNLNKEFADEIIPGISGISIVLDNS